MAARTWQCQVRTPPGRSPCLTSPTPIWRLRVRGRQRAGASHGGDPVLRRTRRHIGGCGGPAPGHGEPPRAGGGSFSVPGRVGRAEIDHACDREHPGTVLRRRRVRRLRARAPAACRPAHEPMTTGRLDRLAVDRGWRASRSARATARWRAGLPGGSAPQGTSWRRTSSVRVFYVWDSTGKGCVGHEHGRVRGDNRSSVVSSEPVRSRSP